FLRSGALLAQPFDTRRLELTGEPGAVAEQVSVADFSVSSSGVLVYRVGVFLHDTDPSGITQGQLTWFDREGKVLGTIGETGLYRTLALSPDGKQVAFERVDPQDANHRNIWLYEFAHGVTTRFTFDPKWDTGPVWFPEGSRIAFGSNRSGQFDLYQKASNLASEDELLYKSPQLKMPSSWSPDGRFLLYHFVISPSQVWALPLHGGAADRKPVPVASSNADEAMGRFSPDGRWVAYESNESGGYEIYVRPFDVSSGPGSSPARGRPVTGKWMVSKGGGGSPLWRGDGKELFYLSPDGMAMAVEVSTSGVFQAGVPKPLFRVPAGLVFWDVSSDGKRFLLPAPSAATSATPFTVVLNWQAALKK
ncbi:MAG TPA: hypothetical protein VI216_11650, partial [Candidatus Acidoferrales bacterium]